MGASSQPESNENPITAYQEREYFSIFSEPYQKPWEMLIFFSLQLQSRPGGPFTIVHATLQVPLASGASDLGMATSWPHQVC